MAQRWLKVKSDGAMELGFGLVICWTDLRRHCVAVVTRRSRDTCSLEGEDGNTCAERRPTSVRLGSRVFSSWAVGFGPFGKQIVCPNCLLGFCLYVVLGLARFLLILKSFGGKKKNKKFATT